MDSHQLLETLLCLLCVPADSPLERLRSLLLRLEALSHILVWALDEPTAGAPEVHRVELPSVSLTFRMQSRPSLKAADDADGDTESEGVAAAANAVADTDADAVEPLYDARLDPNTRGGCILASWVAPAAQSCLPACLPA